MAPDAQQAARLALVEGALLSLHRQAKEDGFDGFMFVVEEHADIGITIDLTYLASGVPTRGESL